MGKIETERASSFLLEPSQYDRHPYLLADTTRFHHRPPNSFSSLRETGVRILFVLCAVLLCASGGLLWPTNPEVKIVDIELNHHANASKSASGSGSRLVSMDLEIQVRNRDFFAREYDSILLLLEYEGRWEGNTTAGGVALDARGTASLQLNAQVRLGDRAAMGGGGGGVAEGFVSVGIAIHIGGNFQFLYFNVVVHGTTSCAITVDPEQQALTCQECCTKCSFTTITDEDKVLEERKE